MIALFLDSIYHTSIVFLQVFKDRKIAENLVRRAEAAGYKAIVLTGDTPRLGRRESDIRNRLCILFKSLLASGYDLKMHDDGFSHRFILPSHVTMKNVDGLINVQTQMDKVFQLQLLMQELN